MTRTIIEFSAPESGKRSRSSKYGNLVDLLEQVVFIGGLEAVEAKKRGGAEGETTELPVLLIATDQAKVHAEEFIKYRCSEKVASEVYAFVEKNGKDAVMKVRVVPLGRGTSAGIVGPTDPTPKPIIRKTKAEKAAEAAAKEAEQAAAAKAETPKSK